MTCTIMVKKMTNMYKYYSNSGTESFDVIFKSDFFKNGDEVIVPVSLCECVINSIIKNSLVPVFVDIDKNFLIKKEDIKKKITNKTRAIIFVEQYGFDINNVCTYKNKKNEKIINILDSCQNIIKNNNSDYDFIVYSFNKNKPISIGKYSLFYSSKKINFEYKISLKLRFIINFKRLLFLFKYLKRRHIYNFIKKNLLIHGYFISHSNSSLHRIVFIMKITKKGFIKLDDKLYEFLDKNNFNCVQTTIEVSPFERLKIKDEFKQFNDYRYKALYFRPSFKKSEYLKVIKYLNDIWGDLNEN